jgi:hypothetical protein
VRGSETLTGGRSGGDDDGDDDDNIGSGGGDDDDNSESGGGDDDDSEDIEGAESDEDVEFSELSSSSSSSSSGGGSSGDSSSSDDLMIRSSRRLTRSTSAKKDSFKRHVLVKQALKRAYPARLAGIEATRAIRSAARRASVDTDDDDDAPMTRDLRSATGSGGAKRFTRRSDHNAAGGKRVRRSSSSSSSSSSSAPSITPSRRIRSHVTAKKVAAAKPSPSTAVRSKVAASVLALVPPSPACVRRLRCAAVPTSLQLPVLKIALNPGGNGWNFWCGIEVALGLVQWYDGSYTLYDGEEDLYGYKDLIEDKEAAARLLTADYGWFDDQGYGAPLVRILRSKSGGGQQVQWFMEQAREKNLSAINRIVEEQGQGDIVKGVLDGLMNGWTQQHQERLQEQHPEQLQHQQQQHESSQQHLRASLRTWRLSAAHKRNELSMAELVAAAQVLHDTSWAAEGDEREDVWPLELKETSHQPLDDNDNGDNQQQEQQRRQLQRRQHRQQQQQQQQQQQAQQRQEQQPQQSPLSTLVYVLQMSGARLPVLLPPFDESDQFPGHCLLDALQSQYDLVQGGFKCFLDDENVLTMSRSSFIAAVHRQPPAEFSLIKRL